MPAALTLLAAFLLIVLVGVGITALHDAVEGAWLRSRAGTPRSAEGAARAGTMVHPVAWRHLH